jgi:hypothetical protein
MQVTLGISCSTLETAVVVVECTGRETLRMVAGVVTMQMTAPTIDDFYWTVCAALVERVLRTPTIALQVKLMAIAVVVWLTIVTALMYHVSRSRKRLSACD